MSEPDLTFHQLAQRLRLEQLPHVEPSAELWPRIARAHRQRLRQARVRRLSAWCGGAGVLLLAALIGASGGWFDMRQPSSTTVDWQARAQALELQLRALNAAASRQVDAAIGSDAQDELVLVDLALQAAYDEGAAQERLTALWKRRSELLDVLVSARRHNMQISRI
ncbi:MAG TPA: hypothetical protein VGH81_15045 [Rudaea sp.]|jgi:hypothetical protein